MKKKLKNDLAYVDANVFVYPIFYSEDLGAKVKKDTGNIAENRRRRNISIHFYVNMG